MKFDWTRESNCSDRCTANGKESRGRGKRGRAGERGRDGEREEGTRFVQAQDHVIIHTKGTSFRKERVTRPSLFVCVCVCVCVRARAHVCSRVFAGARMPVCCWEPFKNRRKRNERWILLSDFQHFMEMKQKYKYPIYFFVAKQKSNLFMFPIKTLVCFMFCLEKNHLIKTA